MIKITTFNLRYAWDHDGKNSFIYRADGILEKINTEMPDVICFQEGTDKNIPFLKRNLTDYNIVFNQRETDFSGEGLATAYRRDRLELLELKFFWLSETPEKPGSRFKEQSVCPRICQCLLFKRIMDGKLFRAYNIHLDHEGEGARTLGIKVVLEHIKEDVSRMPMPFFLMGDFNSTPESEAVSYCNGYADVPVTDLTSHIPFTYHEFGKKQDKIDYIFADRITAELPHSVTPWDDEANGVYLSDHYPVCLETEL